MALRARFTGTGLLWLNRVAGAVILGFGLLALISLLPLPWQADRPSVHSALLSGSGRALQRERSSNDRRGLRLNSLTVVAVADVAQEVRLEAAVGEERLVDHGIVEAAHGADVEARAHARR